MVIVVANGLLNPVQPLSIQCLTAKKRFFLIEPLIEVAHQINRVAATALDCTNHSKILFKSLITESQLDCAEVTFSK